MSADKVETIMIGGGVLVVGYLVYRMLKAAPAAIGGALTGDNALTRGATNASSQPTSAYVGAGPLGTLGAGANAASGGWLASLGESLGGGAFDLFHTDPMAVAPLNPAPPSDGAANSRYLQGGNVASGSGSLDMFSDPEGYGFQYGN
jgi:hypothetical protein